MKLVEETMARISHSTGSDKRIIIIKKIEDKVHFILVFLQISEIDQNNQM